MTTNRGSERFRILVEGIAGELPADEGAQFLETVDTIAPNADLNEAVDKFMLDLLTHPDGGVLQDVEEGSGLYAAIDQVANLYRRLLTGESVPSNEWPAAHVAVAAYAGRADAAESRAVNVARHVACDSGVTTTAARAAASAAATTADASRQQAQWILHHLSNTPK